MALSIDPTEEPRMYQQTLLQDGLYDLLENDKLVDCVLKIKGKEFPCHRLVLCACSSFFRALFLSDLEEEKKREVVLEDVEPGVMGLILKYLYTSTINVTEQNVQDIFSVANMFQIPSIFTVCVSFLQKKLSLSNCLAIFRLGLMLDCPRLAVSARNYACERFQLISRDDEFLTLGPSELAAILTADTLNVETEEEVFEAVEKWVGQDVENRLKELPGLMDCVRLRLVQKDYFTEMVEKQVILIHLPVPPGGEAGDTDTSPCPTRWRSRWKKQVEKQVCYFLPISPVPQWRAGDSDTISPSHQVETQVLLIHSLSHHVEKQVILIHLPIAPENQIFVAGGLFYNELNKEDPLSSYFLQISGHDPVSADWLGMPPIPSPRFLFGLAEAENSIFMVGGKELKEQESNTLDSVLVYDRQSFKWGESDPIPYPVYGHATVSHNGLIYVIGGKSDSK
nr:kelch-like protein 40b [Oncorhynchus nerka]